MLTDHDIETGDEWCRRIGADLELARQRVAGWRGVVVRLAVLVDAVDELVDAGAIPGTMAGPLAQAREALVAGIDRLDERTGAVFEEGLPDDARRAVVSATARYWDHPGYVPAIVLDERLRDRWRSTP